MKKAGIFMNKITGSGFETNFRSGMLAEKRY
jgi:hypothetical protein